MNWIERDCSTDCHHGSGLPFYSCAKEQKKVKSSGDGDNDTALVVDNLGLDHMKLPFPYKLHILLCDMETTGHEHIISWVANGKAFKIHDQTQFETLIQPRYFRQSKMASFIRQCYMYGFSRIECGSSSSHSGSYIHPDFQRDNQEHSLTIRRRRQGSVGSLLRKTKTHHRVHHGGSKGNVSHYTNVSSRSVFIRGRMTSDEPIIIIQGQEPPDAKDILLAAPCLALYDHLNNCVFENDNSFMDLCPRDDSTDLPGNKTIGMLEGDVALLDQTSIDLILEPSPIEELMLTPSFLQEARSRRDDILQDFRNMAGMFP